MKLFKIAQYKHKFIKKARTLYHGTSTEYLSSIQEFGLIPSVGQWVSDSYGMELDEEGLEELIFAADKATIDKSVGAMRYHISKKLNKEFHDIDIEDLRKYGLLVIIRDVEDPKNDDPDSEWQQVPEQQEDWGFYESHPPTTEPLDWYSKHETGTYDIDLLTGAKMIDFLRQQGALSHLEDDKRRRLIKYYVQKYGPEQREEIIDKVMKVPEFKLDQYLREFK
jgi:hypothetical protein